MKQTLSKLNLGTAVVLLGVPFLTLVAFGKDSLPLSAGPQVSQVSANPFTFDAPTVDFAQVNLVERKVRPAASSLSSATGQEINLTDWNYTLVSRHIPSP